jgi:hypothetical protein
MLVDAMSSMIINLPDHLLKQIRIVAEIKGGQQKANLKDKLRINLIGIGV